MPSQLIVLCALLVVVYGKASTKTIVKKPSKTYKAPDSDAELIKTPGGKAGYGGEHASKLTLGHQTAGYGVHQQGYNAGPLNRYNGGHNQLYNSYSAGSYNHYHPGLFNPYRHNQLSSYGHPLNYGVYDPYYNPHDLSHNHYGLSHNNYGLSHNNYSPYYNHYRQPYDLYGHYNQRLGSPYSYGYRNSYRNSCNFGLSYGLGCGFGHNFGLNNILPHGYF